MVGQSDMADDPRSISDILGFDPGEPPAIKPGKKRRVLTLAQMAEVTATPEQQAAIQQREAERRAEWDALQSADARFAGIVGKEYAGCRLSNFAFGSDRHPWKPEQIARAKSVIESLRGIAENIMEAVQDRRRQLILYGKPGVGKDHLAAALMRAAFRAGLSVKWTNGAKFAALVKDQANYSTALTAGVWLKQWTSMDILTISDPDGEKTRVPEDVLEHLYSVIDSRIRSGKVTWITINGVSETGCSARLGPRIWDRLRQGAWLVHCDWPSNRQPRGMM